MRDDITTHYTDERATEQIRHSFAYNRAQGDQAERYAQIWGHAEDLALLLNRWCPPSAEKTLALRCLEECVMRAIQAIAINEARDEG